MFLRLDTHLKNSAACKSVSDTDDLTPPPEQQSSPEQSPPAIPTEPTSHLTYCSQTTQPASSPETNRVPLDILKLPTCQQGWEEADAFLKEQLVPAMLQAASTEDKNRVLSEGIYDYFAQKVWNQEAEAQQTPG